MHHDISPILYKVINVCFWFDLVMKTTRNHPQISELFNYTHFNRAMKVIAIWRFTFLQLLGNGLFFFASDACGLFNFRWLNIQSALNQSSFACVIISERSLPVFLFFEHHRVIVATVSSKIF